MKKIMLALILFLTAQVFTHKTAYYYKSTNQLAIDGLEAGHCLWYFSKQGVCRTIEREKKPLYNCSGN